MENLPPCILSIIHALESTQEHDNQALLKLLDRTDFSENALLEYNTFSHPKEDSYGRNTLYQGKYFSIYIMSWSPGDFTAIHNHGHSEWGAVYFFGDAEHRTYTIEGNKVSLLEKEILKKGTIAPVCGNLTHAMGNLSDTPFFTLHIYGSNSYQGAITEDSTIYELEKNRIRTTLGPAFLDMKDELCKTSKHGIKTDADTKADYMAYIRNYYGRIGKSL